MAGRRVRDDDDGRVIANMNVEGMPWHSGAEPAARKSAEGQQSEVPELSRRERGAIMRGAFLAVLLIALVFLGACFLLLLLLDLLLN